MLQPMTGVRVLEVAQFTFVPSAGAVLADWGADVIKVEHAERGDGQRGLTQVLGLDAIVEGSRFSPIVEAPNRGKRSVGLALEKPEALEILHELIRQSDVFLTNFLPDARAKLGIELEDVRKVNPDIIYVRGSGFGQRGPEAGKGGYDATAFWARGGSGAGSTPADADRLVAMPAGGYGDNLGGMTIAGGVAAALFARATTGETSVIDVSLLGVGAWATQFTANLALMAGGPPPRPPVPRHGSARNPLVGSYRTSDDRWFIFSMLQPGRYWAEFCEIAGRPELVADERFDTVEKLMAGAPQAAEIIAEIVRGKTYDEWLALFEGMEGQWATVQDPWGVANDVSLRANGMIRSVRDVDGVERELISNPVQFDETPVELRRGPQFAEHTDDIIRGLGRTEEELIQLKIAGAIT
ncbi:crotonobetainyl-CoA:carnitine CoA-transferase CaiB-like acyl-CoA transferase [Actinocorallia herbida]|uniref:Crotonobetainyl-CoA:carnitine CoA-transferase CaiB-like acyl-CoA transferase n=1 Tax=Actinocorallia herbida TaxID=58109 RepID=A0A3N1D1R1_9ACTN|nr:CoA transferase [Actinocorallia herbida]ROO87473.1 crotonobetainyl-CoA:carnitine CoA-transferase CaiB-like acyl-CoA transferase [Actinocorallia herbida]